MNAQCGDYCYSYSFYPVTVRFLRICLILGLVQLKCNLSALRDFLRKNRMELVSCPINSLTFSRGQPRTTDPAVYGREYKRGSSWVGRSRPSKTCLSKPPVLEGHECPLTYLPLLSPAVNGWASKQLGWRKLPIALIQPVFVNKLLGHNTSECGYYKAGSNRHSASPPRGGSAYRCDCRLRIGPFRGLFSIQRIHLPVRHPDGWIRSLTPFQHFDNPSPLLGIRFRATIQPRRTPRGGYAQGWRDSIQSRRWRDSIQYPVSSKGAPGANVHAKILTIR